MQLQDEDEPEEGLQAEQQNAYQKQGLDSLHQQATPGYPEQQLDAQGEPHSRISMGSQGQEKKVSPFDNSVAAALGRDIDSLPQIQDQSLGQLLYGHPITLRST